MLVKKQIVGTAYKQLVNYEFKECDIIAVTKYFDQHEGYTKKIIDIILSKENCSIDYIINNYSTEYLSELFNKYRDDDNIFNDDYKNRYEHKMNYESYNEFKKDSRAQKVFEAESKKSGLNVSFENMYYEECCEFFNYYYRKNVIIGCINQLVYDYITNEWLEKYKNNIIHKEDFILETTNGKKMIERSKYYLHLTENLKQEILSKNSIYDWCFPLSIENIEFYKKENCRLLSVAHENILDIFCENEEEYEFLESLGIKFEDKDIY